MNGVCEVPLHSAWCIIKISPNAKSFIDSVIGCPLQLNYSESIMLDSEGDSNGKQKSSPNSKTSHPHRLDCWVEAVIWPQCCKKHETQHTLGFAPCLLLIQNKNNHLLFYPLSAIQPKENFPLLTPPTFRWNFRGCHVKEVPTESLRNDCLGQSPQRGPKSKTQDLLGQGQATGASMRPWAGGWVMKLRDV